MCRQLGYKSASANNYTPKMSLIGTKIPVWFSQINCAGNETNILQCEVTPCGGEECLYDHSKDLAITCSKCIIIAKINVATLHVIATPRML